jgi:hypothetical protein
MSFRKSVIFVACLLVGAAHAQVSPFTVTKTVDDGSANTLRSAINAVNSSCISVPTNPTVIFQLTGTGPFTIQPLSPLPVISCPSTINGASQAGWSANNDFGASDNANIQVILNGSLCSTCDGLNVSSNNVTIRGLSIHSFTGAGVRLSSGYAQLFGNYIGTDPGGMNAFPNGVGVQSSGGQIYVGGSTSSPADRNLITGNSTAGIRTAASANGAFITNNLIGGRRDGTSGMGNGGAGIELNDPATDTHRINDNFIRYNSGGGVVIFAGTAGIQRNSIHSNVQRGIDYRNGAPIPPPVITSVSSAGSTTNIAGQVSGGQPGADAFVDLFDNPDPAPTVSEGRNLLGTVHVVLDGNGSATFSQNYSDPSLRAPGFHLKFPAARNVTATFTVDTCNDSCLETSEFSAPFAAAPLQPPAQIIPSFSTPATVFPVSFAVARGTSDPSYSGMSYTMNLPTGLTFASPSNAVAGCGGTITNLTATSITVTGGSLGGSTTSCVLGSVDVQVPGPGTYTFTVAPGDFQLTGPSAYSNPNAVTGTIDVTAPPPPAPPPPMVDLSPTSLTFGPQAVGTNSDTQTVTIKNTGGSDLTLTSVFASGDFTVAGCSGATLAPNATCTIAVGFTPDRTGNITGSIQIVDNASGSPHSVPLTGTGVSSGTPVLALSATSVTFARQSVGTTSAPQDVVLTNTGAVPLHISSIGINGDFGFTGCGFPLTLAPGTSCTFSITFSPLSNGPLTGSITITSDSSSSPDVIALSGTGANGPQPGLSVRPFSVDFGDTRLGTQRTETVTITSVGTAPLAISSITTGGADFAQTNSCPASLPVGASCDVTVTFTATALGTRSGQLVISTNGDPPTFNVALTGNGVETAPGVLAVDRFLDFGQRVIATTTRLTLDLRNTGEQPINVTVMEVRGTGFALEGSCATIAPAGVCTVTLVFAPPSIDTFTGVLTILSNDARGAIRVDLLGQGVAVPRPEIELSVDGVGFANQFMTTRSPAQRLTIRSVGSAPLHIRGISVTGPFELSGSCPAAMAVGTSCDVSVSFVPPAPGPWEGRLTVDSDAQAGRGFASLTGTGCRFFSVAGMRSLQRLCR